MLIEKDPSLHLRFYGAGEPTMEMDIIKETYEFAHSRSESVVTEIQTNGFFSEATALWIAEHIDLIWVSLDGPPEVHTMYRPTLGGGSSLATIERNIRTLVDQGRGMTGIRTTVVNANIARQKEYLEYFASLGVTNVWADPVVPPVHHEYDNELVDLMVFAAGLIDAQTTAARLGITYGSALTYNFGEDVRFFCRACLPAVRLTTDGYVSACDRAYCGAAPGKLAPFIYGRWDEVSKMIIWDDSKRRYLQNLTVDNLPECRDCPAKLRCGGCCHAMFLTEASIPPGKRSSACDAIRFLFQHRELLNTNYPHGHS